MTIFGDKNKPSEADPILVNPKGTEVQVPKARVKELLAKGFTLKWGQVNILASDEPKNKHGASIIATDVHQISYIDKEKIAKELEAEEDKLEVEIV